MFQTAKWIYTDKTKESACPIFRKSFTLAEGVCNGKIRATAFGMYNLYVNGKRVGDALFAPGFTSYPNRVQVQEYDVTDLLREGENTVSLLCGNGWAVGFLGRGNTNHFFSEHISLRAEINLSMADGKRLCIGTDESWEVLTGTLLESELYHGDIVDLTAPEISLGTALTEERDVAVVPDGGVPVREHERLAPFKLIITPKGEKVIDFGQNLAGYVEVRVKGNRGDRIVISHAEVLDSDGNFYTRNLELARAQNTYVLSGGEDVFKPTFSYQGYRYIRLDEWPFPEVDLSCITSVAVYSEMKRTGSFLCGNEKINKLYQNTIWGQRSNFVDIPTDCPQRDERLGWTGDIQVFLHTAAINYDVERFMRKWFVDLRLEQREDGAVGSVVPGVANRGERTSTAWGDASVVCPWELYLAYNCLDELEANYPMMQKWIEYMHNAGEEEYLWLGGDHYGDWLASDAILCPEVREGATQTDLIASAFFGYSVSLMAKVSRALGKDAAYYEDMFVKIKDAFQRIFMKDGLPVLYPKYDALSTTRPVKALTQTSLVLILKFGLYKDEAERVALAKKLVEMIDENGGKMSTGFVGTPYILEVLTENGYADRAYDLFLQEQSPSWIFSVNRGATTIWEHWDGIKEDGSFWDHCKNSFNHYAYGSVFEWVYGMALGVRVCPDGAGYRKITIQPHPDRRLGFAWGRIDTRLGALEARWSYQTEGIRYDFTIPEGCEATLTLPDGRVMELTAGGYTFVTEDR